MERKRRRELKRKRWAKRRAKRRRRPVKKEPSGRLEAVSQYVLDAVSINVTELCIENKCYATYAIESNYVSFVFRKKVGCSEAPLLC